MKRKQSQTELEVVFDLPRPVWIVLVVLDAIAFFYGLLGGSLYLSGMAFVLALFIEHFGHQKLVGAYDERMESLRGTYQLTPEQRKEVVEELREQREEKRRERKEHRARRK